jgi:hypothetical protein
LSHCVFEAVTFRAIHIRSPLARNDNAHLLPSDNKSPFATFEEYCDERWHFGKAYAYRLFQAAEVIENLSPIGDIP